MLNARIARALATLKDKGFKPANSSTKNRKFHGEIQCKKGSLKIGIEISDWDFISYPSIQLLETPEFLPNPMPHLMGDMYLCYFIAGHIILDRYHPEYAVIQCLQQATKLIDYICETPSNSLQGIQDEFLSYWVYGQTEDPIPVFIGDTDASIESASFHFGNLKDVPICLISQNDEEANGLFAAMNLTSERKATGKCWILQSNKHPMASKAGLPKNINNLFAWLKEWDPTIHKKIQDILGNNKSGYLDYKSIFFAIKTPAGILGFSFDLDYIHRKSYRNNAARFRQYLHSKGMDIPISRLRVVELGANYIHNRNILSPSLINKSVILLGCGSIGGYLAQALVRMGAGVGKMGQLTLIDCGYMEPDNLGRHVLGFSSVLLSKAEALKNELLKQFPYLNIIAKNELIRPTKSLFKANYLISATGEEAVNEMINEHSIPHLTSDTKLKVVYVWITGNGECVQSLLVDNMKLGCYHCQYEDSNKFYRKERFKTLKAEPELGYKGCTSFTPYSVSAPMHAASLALDTIIDDLQGHPSPRFRTRYIENTDTFKIKSQDLTKIQSCAACGQH